ncbi:serine hydrolase domain-containing protein [Stackebrandtia nassauensis]|uniref:Beta-lactamase n=1 Tax=Stackebrandtia nassauensis (strain DSM 44728 / CIP 108903 / NRRL B-16338 / NBRC 102104 / LLR-40K-21) TaxID=446470 RepID=D3Q1M3_STANL|nr:serine hydrolase domain-containing protein [Stackebrandtia nassauensis]ADD39871.1 beta-lactamase [Stackebrandtia nassauensis DSM 44728]
MASRRTVLGLAGAATVAAGITVASSGIAEADSKVPDGLKPGGELDRYVKKLAAEGKFSGAFLLTHKRRKVLSRAYGMADAKAGVRNETDTRFKLASVTKMFTAVAINKLVQDDKVRYAEPIGKYIDGFSDEVAEKVTIHHLLLHTSGLGDFHDLPGYEEASRKWDTPDEVMNGTLDFIREDKLRFPPGAGWQYSNAAYCVLGGIIAAVSKQSYFDYVRDNVFEPARMRASDFYTRPQWQKDPKLAHPYFKDDETGEWVDRVDEQAYIGLPAGNSFATVGDMNRFANALLDAELLSRQFTHIMLTPKLPVGGGGKEPPPDPDKPRMTGFLGYGTFSSLIGDQRVHGFSGGSQAGPSTSIDIYPDSDWVTVILTNRDPSTVPEVNKIITKHILGAK